MIIYPAIDIIGGQCVRLSQGRYSNVTVYEKDPVEVAKRFEDEGAKFIHVVDLDGAKSGENNNFSTISKIASSVKIPVQTGGGIREESAIKRYFENGINRVILGTKAVNDKAFLQNMLSTYKEKIVVGIDAKDGYVAIEGWEKVSEFTAVEFGKTVCEMGCKTIIYTDIATDGMLKGPNLEAMKEMASAVNCDVIASGGISCIEDIAALLKTNVSGAITGKALYTGRLDLKEAIKLAGGNR